MKCDMLLCIKTGKADMCECWLGAVETWGWHIPYLKEGALRETYR